MFNVKNNWVNKVIGAFSFNKDSDYDETNYSSTTYLDSQSLFSQAELNQLKVALSQAISDHETQLRDNKHNLQTYLESYELSKDVRLQDDIAFYRKDIARLKKRIKMLSHLAWKVKHKLFTLG